jgi:hypothetical protein
MEPRTRRICPQCGYEYESWIEICPDCGVLVETVSADQIVKSAKGRLDPDDDPRWTVVTNVPNAIIGNLIKSQLEDAGIPVFMQRSPSADIAFFSHNDYVPHDLRVPLSMVEDARRILDSSPDRSQGAPYWGSDLDDEDEDESGDEEDRPSLTSFGGSGSIMPEGWTMLPTERDLHAGRHYYSTHGDAEGWYRSDAIGERPFGRGGTAAEEPDYDFDEEPLESDKIRFSQPYQREYYDEAYGSPDRSKWIRVIYGILLLIISLPFLLQLMQQIASFLTFSH